MDYTGFKPKKKIEKNSKGKLIKLTNFTLNST